MADPFSTYKHGQISWFDRNPAKSNKYCLYCGVFVGDGSVTQSNDEHLFGKQFVPKGSFNRHDAFNFRFRACLNCNNTKADIEGHISAITLMLSPARNETLNIDTIAESKERTFYRSATDGTRVGDAKHHTRIKGTFGPASLSFGYQAPAQIPRSEADFLAKAHIQGLFSLLTSREPTDTSTLRLLPAERVHIYGVYPVQDWGNSQLSEITNRIQGLETIADIVTAEGFLKAKLIAGTPDDPRWFWALEWNKQTRVVGGISQNTPPHKAFENLPKLNWEVIAQDTSSTIRRREERPLGARADALF